MKLSERNTGDALDVICEVIPYVGNIVSDEELITEIKERLNPTGDESIAGMFLLVTEKVYKIAPILLKKHREDVYQILAIMNCKTPEEIDAQNVLITLLQIRDILKDKELISFFRSSKASEQTK